MLARATISRSSASRACQPVVPTTSATPRSASRGAVAKVPSGVEKSTATARSSQSASVTPAPPAFDVPSSTPASSKP
jgi:hypothetical protein